jgi:hypothetical protein
MSVKLTIQNCIPSRDDGGRCKVSEITAGAKSRKFVGSTMTSPQRYLTRCEEYVWRRDSP